MNDEDQAVMFGGYSPSEYSSKACVLHLPTIVSQIKSYLNSCMSCSKCFSQKILTQHLLILNTIFIFIGKTVDLLGHIRAF